MMISRKKFATRAPSNHLNSQHWAAGLHQGQSGFEEKALAVFQPDILIPVQFLATYQRRFSLDPELGLMLAVLQDAVICFQEHLGSTCKRKRALFLDAEEWLFDGDQSYLFSFENVCEALGFQSDYIRRGLLRWREAALKNAAKHSSKRLAS
jgi:hypothetical protein